MAAVMKKGMQGSVIATLQARLAEHGYHISIDGIFGPKTENVVKQFQDEHGLKIDGIAGPRTIEALFPRQKPVYTPPKRHTILDLSLVEVLERANGCVGAPVIYNLPYPNGGTDPEANMPCDPQTGYLDCSGFTAWVLGYDRDFEDGMSPILDQWDGYSNTDSKLAEAERMGLLYEIVEEPEPGDLIVGGSYRKLTGQKVYGHEGVVVAVRDFKLNGLAGVAVVHCSKSNSKLNKDGSAIWKTSGTVWKNFKKLRFLRFNREYALEQLKSLRR